MKKIITIITLSLIVFSCATQKAICPCDAEENVLIENVALKIEAFASINKMPTIDANKKTSPMLMVRIISTNNQKLPETFTIEKYGIRLEGEDGMSGEFTETNIAPDGQSIQLIARDLVELTQQSEFDVAVEIKDSEGNRHYIKKDAVIVTVAY